MPFPENYLLKDPLAIRLYDAVKDLPLVDWHNHLAVDDLVRNRTYANLTELWVEYVKALREVSRLQEDFNYTFVEANGKTQGQNAKDKTRQIYNNLPQELKIYVGSFGELLRKARDIDDTSLKYAENNFMKTMPELRKEHEMRLLGAKSVDMLQENNQN